MKHSTRAAAKGVHTKLATVGRDTEAQQGFVNPPVVHGSTVLYPTAADLEARNAKYNYARRGSPTSDALCDAINTIEGGAGTVLCPSGLNAISTALLSALSAGDHLLVTDSAYRPTRIFCDTVLKRFGVETSYYDPALGGGIEALFRPNTRAVFTEAPGSQSFEMQDIPAIAEVAHRHNALVLMDNTWATPLYFPAHQRGVDLSIMAGTKYISGHSDVMFGYVSASAAAWPRLRRTWDDMGICVGPDDMFLALRGLRTMGRRLEHHQKAALEVARWLQARPEVLKVMHPALPDDPGHALWKRDFTGSSGLFSFVLKPVRTEAVHAMLDDLALFGMGFSWGGFESLIIPFDCADYRTATQWNPGGPALRIHIGLEDVSDLIADLEAGFARLNANA